MNFRKPLWLVFLLALSCLGAVSSLAQETLSQTYSGEEIRFDYPEDWAICQDCDQFIVVANNEQALYANDLRPTDIQIGIFPSLEAMLELSPNDINSNVSPAALLAALSSRDIDDIESYTIGTRTLAHVIVENETLAASSIMVVVERGDGGHAFLVGTTSLGAAENYVDITLAIAETLTTADFEEIAPTPTGSKVRSTPQPTLQTSSEDVELSQSFELSDGSFSFRYPEGWEMIDRDDAILLYSDDAIFDFENPADYPDGVVFVAIHPTPESFPDGEFLEGGSYNASTVISFYASFGIVSGARQDGPMDVFTLDQREASAVLMIEADGFEHYYLAIEHEGDDSSLLQAIAAPGQIEELKPILQAIAASFELG